MKSLGNYFFVKKCEVTKNFTQIPNQIFKLKLTSIEKLVLMYLFSNSESFRITNYRIQKDLNLDIRVVKKAMEKLTSLKFISINEKFLIIDLNKIENPIDVNLHIGNSTQVNQPIDVNLHICKNTPIVDVNLHNTNTNQDQIQKEPQEENFEKKVEDDKIENIFKPEDYEIYLNEYFHKDIYIQLPKNLIEYNSKFYTKSFLLKVYKLYNEYYLTFNKKFKNFQLFESMLVFYQTIRNKNLLNNLNKIDISTDISRITIDLNLLKNIIDGIYSNPEYKAIYDIFLTKVENMAIDNNHVDMVRHEVPSSPFPN